MQNRLYAVALLVILGICCLGLYVGVTQVFNSRAPFTANASPSPPLVTPLVVILGTVTPTLASPLSPSAVSPTAAPTLPILPVPSPILPTAVIIVPTPTLRPVSPTPQPPVSACGGLLFCNTGGPPDPSLAPSSSTGCPTNYIWGKVLDLSGRGIAEKKIRFRDPQGETGQAVTKNVPDVPGKYDIPTGAPGSSWVVWILNDDGSPASPQVSITTQNYLGGSICPNRIDFKQQR
jgi:hypothetical protein